MQVTVPSDPSGEKERVTFWSFSQADQPVNRSLGKWWGQGGEDTSSRCFRSSFSQFLSEYGSPTDASPDAMLTPVVFRWWTPSGSAAGRGGSAPRHPLALRGGVAQLQKAFRSVTGGPPPQLAGVFGGCQGGPVLPATQSPFGAQMNREDPVKDTPIP